MKEDNPIINVILNSKKEVYNLTEEEEKKIKADLTLPNPAYISALRYSPYAKVNLPKTISYYEYRDGSLCVPRGYEIPFENQVIEDVRFENKVYFPKVKITPRDMQIGALESFGNRTDAMLISPTGSGKSIVALLLLAKLNQKALVLVHKDDLFNGWINDAKMCFGLRAGQIGAIKGQVYRVGKWITISTIQTLSKLSVEKLEELRKEFSIIVCDECLVSNTLILNEDGGWDTIDKIKNKDRLYGGKVSNQFKAKKPTILVDSPYGKIEGSYQHRTFYVPNSVWGDNYKLKKEVSNEGDFFETELENIEVGDYIPVIKKIPHTTKYKYTPDQLGFVALIMADGHMDDRENSRRIKINVTKDKEWYREIFTKGANSWKEFDVKESIDCRGNLTLWVNSLTLRDILINDFEVPSGKKSNKIFINKLIQHSPIASIKRFIEIFISCEGDLNVQNNSYRISTCTTSKRMAMDLQMILKKFSVLATYFEIKSRVKNNNDSYRIGISGEFFNKFMQEFNLLERKMSHHKNQESTNAYIHAGENYILSKVKNIVKNNSVQEVYDFTTEEHFFIANGVMTHNCHHTPSSSFSLVNTFPAKYRIGVTATPIRNDGLGEVMFFYFGKPFYEYKESEANKDIIPPSKVFVKKKIVGTVFNPEERYVDTKSGREITKILDNGVYRNIDELTNFEIEFYISKKLIKRKPMDYMQARKTIQNDQFFMKQLCKDIEKEVAEEKSCVVFCFEKEHCRAIFDFLREMGISQSVMQLYYGDSKESKELMKEKAERKEVLVTIATYAIATEGTNLRSWERLFFTIGPGNAKDTIQAIGRGRRTFAGKSDLVVYDYVFPNVMGIRNHFRKREKVYKDIGFKII